MGLRKDSNARPEIAQVSPAAAIAGGEFQIRGKGFAKSEWPRVTIGDVVAPLTVGSDSLVIAKVPEGASTGELVVTSGDRSSQTWACDIGIPIADSLHPVANPAVDSFGNIYTTFSGSRGQKAPVAVYKIDLNYSMKPFINDLMNASGLALDWDGMLYITSRFDGVVYQATPNGNISVYVEGMGVATGIAFDDERNMYVGDRSGTIFKITQSGKFSLLHTFSALDANAHNEDGAYPLRAIVVDPGGNLYGTTRIGGENTCGESGCDCPRTNEGRQGEARSVLGIPATSLQRSYGGPSKAGSHTPEVAAAPLHELLRQCR